MTKKSPNRRSPKTSSDNDLLENRLRLLRLPTILAQYANVAQRSATENATFEAYLNELVGLELDHREGNAQARRIKAETSRGEGACRL